MFATIIGGMIFVGSQAWEWTNFIQGEYGAVETRAGRILQFVNTDGERVSLEDFAKNLPSERSVLTRSEALWYDSESSIPTVNYSEVLAGFMEDKNILVRTDIINENGEKTILSREESIKTY